jgi:hypothetical protein
MYVAGGIADRRPALWTSPDGKTWTRVDGIARGIAGGAKGPASSAITGVAANDDAVIAIGMDAQSDEPGASTVRAWVSRDGVAWTTARGERFANGQVFSAATTPDGFIATGPSGGDSCRGGIWESTDGTSWKCVASAAAFEGFSPYAAAASPSVTVAVGFDGATDLPDGFPGAVWRKAAP